MMIPRALSFRIFQVSEGTDVAEEVVDGIAALIDVDAAVEAAGDVVLACGADGSGSSPETVPQTFSRCNFPRIRIFQVG